MDVSDLKGTTEADRVGVLVQTVPFVISEVRRW